MRLDPNSLADLSGDVARPSYDRAKQKVGVVHFGIGAFHRAHQAWYTDACMNAGERDWAVAGVSLRSPSVAHQLNPQGRLYTLTQRSSEGAATRLIGAVRKVLVAGQDSRSIIDRIAAPECRIVSFTVTEKGYCRAEGGGLDIAAAQGGFYPLLTSGLAQRKRQGLGGVTLLSCDNLSDNGRQLGRLMVEWLERHDRDLAAWFERECTCPNSMVDRIVPATTEADRAEVEGRIGLRDEGAVVTEPFSQWVIEDRFAGSRPGWNIHGAHMVADVAPYETAKLRMLNGAHSALAYCGLDRGYSFVHEAIADTELRALVQRLMREEAAPTITADPDQDLPAYAAALTARFENPALNHRLDQIAMDGSQKIPQRWLETLTANQLAGRRCPAILEALAAWLRHIRGDRRPVVDPLAVQLRQLWAQTGADGIAPALFGAGGMLASRWSPTEDDLAFLREHAS